MANGSLANKNHARGRAKSKSVWEQRADDLKARRCPFRLLAKVNSSVIYVREYRAGKVAGTWSTKIYKVADDEHVEAAYQLCLKCQRHGQWVGVDVVQSWASWPQFADLAIEKHIERVPKKSSHNDTVSFIRQWAKFTGKVEVEKLRAWANNIDPTHQQSKHRKAIQAFRDINRLRMLDMDEAIDEQIKRRPTSQEVRRQADNERPRAIADTEAIRAWLHTIKDPEVRWLFAMAATYGLRPSEAWHVTAITDKGWAQVPAKPICKTFTHPAKPCPESWVDEFGLQENFREMQDRIRRRWAIKWQENANGSREPLNNSQVSNAALYGPLKRWGQRGQGGIEPLQGTSPDGQPDWLRPYDFRHAYAIRLLTHPETRFVALDRHAYWMGHDTDIHRRIYLQWIDPNVLAASEEDAYADAKARNVVLMDAEPAQVAPQGQGLPEDVQAKLAKLEQLEQTLKNLGLAS